MKKFKKMTSMQLVPEKALLKKLDELKKENCNVYKTKNYDGEFSGCRVFRGGELVMTASGHPGVKYTCKYVAGIFTESF